MDFFGRMVSKVGGLFGGGGDQAEEAAAGVSQFTPAPAPGVFPPQPAPPPQQAPPPQLTGPTQVKSSIGEMTVYPDDFVGPLPAGAVRQSEHKQMVDIYNRVDSGKSQLKVDSSSFTEGKGIFDDPMGYLKGLVEGEAWRQQQLEYMKELVKTPAGLQMMADMDKSKYTTTIGAGSGNTNETGYDDIDAASMQADGKKGAGSNVTITMNPKLNTYADPGEKEEAWMTERQKYGLYHEMVHGWHAIQGDRATGEHNGKNNSEWQAMGMGAPYAGLRVTDNVIRQQMGKETRPNYGGATY